MVIKGCKNNLTNKSLVRLETNAIAKTSMPVSLREVMLNQLKVRIQCDLKEAHF